MENCQEPRRYEHHKQGQTGNHSSEHRFPLANITPMVNRQRRQTDQWNDKGNRPLGQKTERDRGPARQMPREEKFLFRFYVFQTSPASPKKINCPGNELGENNIGRQHARHDEVEERTLQNQCAPETDTRTAQRAAEQITHPDPAEAGQRQRQPHSPFVRAEHGHRNGDRAVRQRRFVQVRHIPEVRNDPIAQFNHLAGDFGVTALVRLVQRTAAEEKEEREQRQRHQPPPLARRVHIWNHQRFLVLVRQSCKPGLAVA